MKTQPIPMSKPIEQALNKRELFTKLLFTRPESLSSLLPYDGVIDSENILQIGNGLLVLYKNTRRNEFTSYEERASPQLIQ